MSARPLVLAYHVGGLGAVPSIAARAEVRTITAKPFTRAFSREGAGVVPRWSELPRDRPIVLVGWSEGVQAIRAHLRDGGALDAGNLAGVVALDGAHASRPPSEAEHLAPWRRLVAQRRVPWLISSSRVPTTDYMSTREVLGRLGLPTDDGRHRVGAGEVWATAGGSAAEHVRHAQAAPAEVVAMLDRIPADWAPGRAPAVGAALVAALVGAGGLWWARARGWWS